MNFDFGQFDTVDHRFITPKYSALAKCCGCIHLRAGGAVACIVWAVSSIVYLKSFSECYRYIVTNISFAHRD